jgi:choline dehydrogenase
MAATYDFIIVGGGSAGSALANRLSADPGSRVLVLEAGRPDYRWDVFIHMPAALTFPIGSRFYDWRYESEPEPFMNGRRIYHARGKVLGGSSSINGMIFQRGNPLDYARWAADPGMADWDYAHCLPYFKRMENCLAGADEFRGGDGPLVLERGPATNPLFAAFFAAVQEAGYPLTDDVNGYRQEGFAPFDRNLHRGRRLSAARAYLHPVAGRANLTVRTRAYATKILFDGRRATGVRYLQGGQAHEARAGEVILCGGSINSPQLLQLSGVGGAKLLEQVGVDVVHDLPGVGENLQDHLEVYVQYGSKQPVSVAPALKMRNRPMVGAKWLFLRSGPGATNHFEAGGFARSNDDVAYPNLMFHFLPIAIRYDGSSPAGGHGYQVHIGPMNSDARGSVRITSADPAVHPALRFNYLSTEQDRREWVEAIRVARTILGQPAMDPFNAGELSPGPAVHTDEQILDWVRRDGETALHPSCTCAMGAGPQSVADPATMRVHGLDGLRVVDASVMPYLTNGNIYAPVMMIAEKSADLILGNTPLAPSPAQFYVHQPAATATPVDLASGEVLGAELLRLDEHQPVTGVVTHHGLDAVGPVARLLKERHALGAELLKGLAAVVGAQAQAAHLALLQLVQAVDSGQGDIRDHVASLGGLSAVRFSQLALPASLLNQHRPLPASGSSRIVRAAHKQVAAGNPCSAAGRPPTPVSGGALPDQLGESRRERAEAGQAHQHADLGDRQVRPRGAGPAPGRCGAGSGTGWASRHRQPRNCGRNGTWTPWPHWPAPPGPGARRSGGRCGPGPGGAAAAARGQPLEQPPSSSCPRAYGAAQPRGLIRCRRPSAWPGQVAERAGPATLGG